MNQFEARINHLKENKEEKERDNYYCTQCKRYHFESRGKLYKEHVKYGKINHLKKNQEKKSFIPEDVKKEMDLKIDEVSHTNNFFTEDKHHKQSLKQNINDIERFYNFLGHNSKTNFQVFLAMTHIKTSSKPSNPSKQSFVPNKDITTLLQLCNSYKLKGVICLGINERPDEQTKLTDILPKINVILFDIDVRKNKKINGISPNNLKQEAKEIMERCKTRLEEIGFVVDLIVDSGNGYHIYIKIDLDIPKYDSKEDFEESNIYKRLVYLETQMREFNTKNVEIDFLSKDVIRRVKIPGTYNVKRYKDIDGKFKLIPKDQWRLAKIVYLNENINEKQNNTIFMNLPIDSKITVKKKDTTDIFKLRKKPNILEPNFLERLNKLLEKDEKLKDLYNGIWKKYYPETDTKKGSRSEAEAGFITKLIHYKFNESEIYTIMDNCKIGKWEEKADAYKRTTIKEALKFIEKLKKTKQNEREKLYNQFYKETKTLAIYTGKGGLVCETKAFQKWYKNKKRKTKRIKDINTKILLEDIKNEISTWDENFKEDKIIYEIFKKLKDETKEKTDKLISLMAKHLKYYDVNKLKRLKIVCELDDIVKELSIDLDLETITDEEIKRISLEINARRVVILDSLFMWFFFNLGIKEERVRNALLPYIKETTEFIIEKHPCFILTKTKNIYYFGNGVYIKQDNTPKDFLEEIILKEIPYNIKEIAGELKINRRIKMVAKEIIARIQINEKDLNFDILNFPNGILSLEDIKNKKWNLKPHDPKYKSILQLTIPFDPSIKNSKKIKPFFIKQLGKEQFLRLMQLYGISLVGTPWKWKAITFLDGKTGTGKSEVIFKTLETIIPPNYISYEPFSNLIVDGGDFALGSLLGSFINIHGDIGDEALSHPEGINKLTEEDIIVNEKYGFKGTIKNRCSHFYAMNIAPQISKEERLDVFRRIEYLKIFGDSIPENERDPDYFKKIIENDPNEMIAMLNEILNGLSKTLNTGNITPRPVLEKREIYRQASLPLLSFIKKWCLHFETGKKTKPNETYLIERHYFLQIYNKYRSELNLEKIENLWALTDEEKRLSYKIYKIQKGPERCYKGIRFNNEAYKHFNINLEEVKEQKIYYPEGTLYESTKQTNLTGLIKAGDKNDNVNHSDPERLF